MQTVDIFIIDNRFSYVENKDIPRIAACLKYTAEYWQQGEYNKVRKNYPKFRIDRATGIFLTGLIPRIKLYCIEKGFQCTIHPPLGTKPPQPLFNIQLPDITLRDDQTEMIRKAFVHHRGVILSPTGSGKTVMALGFFSLFRNSKCLFIVHTKDLMSQTASNFARFGFYSYGQIGDGKKQISRITVGMIQSLYKIADELLDFDVIIVDEAHHIKEEGTYEKLLSKINAEYRIGFTATMPKEIARVFTIEGLLGPVIGETKIEELAENMILAKPKIVLLDAEFNTELQDVKRYAEAYQFGIVSNSKRNRQIAGVVNQLKEKWLSVLCMVTKIEHGLNLEKVFSVLYPNLRVVFIHGATEAEERDITKASLMDGRHDCVICTTIWKEGVDIPPLGAVVNCSGGRSEIATLQTIGRGLRRTNEKDEVIIVDFMDRGNRYLAQHSLERIKVYHDMGWIGNTL